MLLHFYFYFLFRNIDLYNYQLLCMSFLLDLILELAVLKLAVLKAKISHTFSKATKMVPCRRKTMSKRMTQRVRRNLSKKMKRQGKRRLRNNKKRIMRL